MITLSNLKPHPNNQKRRKTVGRGLGTGHGTQSGRGAKGQKARSGGKIRAGFEGGRMPLIRQVPKTRGKGFSGNPIAVQEVNLSDLSVNFADNETVTPEILLERGLINDVRRVKILSNGDLKGRKLNVSGVAMTASAREKISAAGGKIEDTEGADKASQDANN